MNWQQIVLVVWISIGLLEVVYRSGAQATKSYGPSDAIAGAISALFMVLLVVSL